MARLKHRGTLAHSPVVITTGAGNYTRPNPRGCPGSYARVRNVGGKAVCPFCNQDKPVRKDGTLKAHARPR